MMPPKPVAPAMKAPAPMVMGDDTGADTDLDTDSLDAVGKKRRMDVSTEALAGGDANTLPADVQQALVETMGKFAQATGTEAILKGGVEDAVALLRSAHDFLAAQGSPNAAGLDPQLLLDPNTAMMVIDAMNALLQDPETMEMFTAPAGAPPEAETPAEDTAEMAGPPPMEM